MKRSSGTPVNLLPLLDVLLCTMGTLIVVLGVLSRMARNHSVAHEREELAIAKEQVTLRIEQLTTAREKTIADLDAARRRLSGVEDHSRQLADKLKTLTAAARQLSTDKSIDDKRDALRRELNQLNADRAQLEKDLQAAKNSIGQHKVMFSIVPFDGVYKTNRRPIYIECRGDSIILQPEGIVLTPNDFLGPPGPGNPLASALRAAQEYWSQTPPPGAEVSNDPYPLLLVRPDGIIAYYLARDAMASWNAEFGYELISADGKLEFPAAPEPRLVEMERRAVDEARQRLQWLAQVSPESFQHKKNVQYRVSAIRGGLVRDGAPSLGNDPFANDPLGGFGKSAGGNPGGRGDSGPGGGNYPQEYRMADARGNAALGFGGNGSGAGNGYGADGGGSRVFGNGGMGSAASGLGGTGSVTGATAGSSSSGANGQGQSSLVGPRYAGAGAGTGAQENGPQLSGAGMAGAPGGAFNGSSDGTTQNGNSPMSGRLAVRGNGSSASGSPSAGGSMSEGDSGQGSTSSGGSASGGAASAASSSQGQSGMGSSSDPSQMSGVPSPSLNFNANQQRSARKLANERGRNWALQTNTNASVPITRPIRIECWNDRLILVPDGFDQHPQVIPLADRTDEAVDQLVAAVRVHTQGWGLAGRSMYWKPQLVLDVKPSAESRANDLQVLLADSGLDVKRK